MTAEVLAIEPARLAHLETVIERGIGTFIEVGHALTEVRDSRLYRGEHATFEGYLLVRWNMTRQQGYRLMEGAQVAALVSPMGDMPNERQARELVPLMRETPAAIPVVWQEAVDRSGGQPTAAVVREVVAEHRPSRITSGLMSSESDEWYTPRSVIERVLRAWPVIDLDPAADPGPVHNVPAERHHDIHDSGLDHGWQGRVFLNPPYGDSLPAWAAKVALEADNMTEAIVLVPARTETRWWHAIPADVVCFFKGRLSFFNGATGKTGPAPFPSAALYVGNDPARFIEAFGSEGLIYQRVRS